MNTLERTKTFWCPEWHSKNRLDGEKRYLMYKDGFPALFNTRQECRDWIHHTHGYILERSDLRVEPHGWRLPRAVRVKLELA